MSELIPEDITPRTLDVPEEMLGRPDGPGKARQLYRVSRLSRLRELKPLPKTPERVFAWATSKLRDVDFDRRAWGVQPYDKDSYSHVLTFVVRDIALCLCPPEVGNAMTDALADPWGESQGSYGDAHHNLRLLRDWALGAASGTLDNGTVTGGGGSRSPLLSPAGLAITKGPRFMSERIPDDVPEEVRKRLQWAQSIPKTPWDVLVWAETRLWELHEHEPELRRSAIAGCKRGILSGITKGIEGTLAEKAIIRSHLGDSVTKKLASLARDVAIGACPPDVIREVQRTTTHETFRSAYRGLGLLRDWTLAAMSDAAGNGTATENQETLFVPTALAMKAFGFSSFKAIDGFIKRHDVPVEKPTPNRKNVHVLKLIKALKKDEEAVDPERLAAAIESGLSQLNLANKLQDACKEAWGK